MLRKQGSESLTKPRAGPTYERSAPAATRCRRISVRYLPYLA